VTRLVRVADGAFPQFGPTGAPDYSFLPADVHVWAGYVGGHTPHSWSVGEIGDARRLVGAWWGIWTAPSSTVLTAAIGQDEGARCLARLISINYPPTDPVLLDVERSSWVLSPAGADACFAAWAKAIAAGGYHNADWYGPRDSHAGWRADWTGIRPLALPVGVKGVQYDHALSGDRYDISVFDLDLVYPQGGNVILDSTDLANIAKAVWAQPVDDGTGGAAQGVAGHRLAYIDERVNKALTAIEALQTQVAKIVTAQGPQSAHGTWTTTTGP
jgi:hypothetical protein